MWVDDRDVSAAEEIGRVAGAASLDPAPILAGLTEPETKDLLRATTEEAVARGAFGAPTFFVGDRMYWGNDRIDLLEWELTH
jgi:2-hydroxychromene-2-carboxylate isomerase